MYTDKAEREAEQRKLAEATRLRIKAEEQARRAKSSLSATAVQAIGEQDYVNQSVPAVDLKSPVEAVGYVESRLPSLFVAMVEQGQGLLPALKLLGISSATFFTALDASQSLREWYRGVKAAQAVLDVEKSADIMRELDEAAQDAGLGNGVRNAMVGAAKIKRDQARWMAQRVLPALCGEKQQTQHSGKIEIVVRREARKAAIQAVQDET